MEESLLFFIGSMNIHGAPFLFSRKCREDLASENANPIWIRNRSPVRDQTRLYVLYFLPTAHESTPLAFFSSLQVTFSGVSCFV
jgi:hypothetical protein